MLIVLDPSLPFKGREKSLLTFLIIPLYFSLSNTFLQMQLKYTFYVCSCITASWVFLPTYWQAKVFLPKMMETFQISESWVWFQPSPTIPNFTYWLLICPSLFVSLILCYSPRISFQKTSCFMIFSCQRSRHRRWLLPT